MRASRRLVVAAGLLWTVCAVTSTAQRTIAPSLLRQHPAIGYGSAPVDDAVARLMRRMSAGQTQLTFDPATGYLPSVLRALNVPVESQVLVFSKTSFQASRINPQNPRALYFSDDVSVGWVRGGDYLEFVAQDPRQGAVFYVLKQTPEGARFERSDTSCLSCHVSEATRSVPGMFVGSVFPGRDGMTMYGPAYTTDDRTPFALRWGGWYVNGTHRAQRHMGNAVVVNESDLGAMVTSETLQVPSLNGRVDMSGYPSPASDIVALMVLEHQAHMANLITRLGWEARVGADAGRPLRAAAVELVDYMVFANAAPVPGPVSGVSTFAATFAARGPFDSRGRSLRQLDLTSRLLRYPCSFMIYSEAFDALPDRAKSEVYSRLWEVLSGADAAAAARLTPSDRTAIIEILRDTKAGLPDYFQAVG